MEKAARDRHADLEAWETALRAAVLSAGAKAMAALLDGIGSGCRETPVICRCGAKMESRGRKRKELLTILGPVPYRRSVFECPVCHGTRYPGDEDLDIAGTTRSPALRRMMARAGSKSTFKEGSDDLLVYAGIEVSAKDVERVAEAIGEDIENWSSQKRSEIHETPSNVYNLKTVPVLYVSFDGTGVPMTRTELAGRKGKQPDGSARTREAKLGCVFTQTTTDKEGFPVRDPDSTTFVGAIETAEEFGWRIYKEAYRRGMPNAHRVVVLGDGAEWIKGIVEMHFPNAIQIIDLYHTREHVASLCKLLCPDDAKNQKKIRDRWWAHLDAGDIPRIIREAEKRLPENAEIREECQREINYLSKNRDYMRYAKFRSQGFFVGSGVIEAGCKTVIGQRMKQSGMEWSLRGANAIIALRSITLSNRLDDYWEDRTA